MTYKYIMIAAGVFGLIHYFVIRDQFVRLITGGLLVAISLTFVPIHNFDNAGILVFALTCFLAIIYAQTKQPIVKGKKLLIGLTAVPLIFINVYAIQRLPHMDLVGLLSVISLLAYLIIVSTNIKKYKEEIGFLTIMAVDAGVKLSMSLDVFFA